MPFVVTSIFLHEVVFILIGNEINMDGYLPSNGESLQRKEKTPKSVRTPENGERVYEVKAASKEALREVAKNGFQLRFQKLYERWQKCIAAQGDYFESEYAMVM
ncbi:hypothetical protein TNCV_4329521 [Trichonephila clavipes]|nr:hypothetical protein TNCV_4329521 [Trichonephila clavipes]